MNDIRRILEAASQHGGQVSSELLPLVYDELRALAARGLASEREGQTLQATALVHEAWLRLSGEEEMQWNDRAHFFRAAAQAMRRILVDRARAKAQLLLQLDTDVGPVVEKNGRDDFSGADLIRAFDNLELAAAA